jgi:uncharacterized SAM-binding protein YcdF (DUF218 family)
MFFLLSKVLGILTDPLVIIFFFLILGVVFKRFRKRCTIIGFALLLFFSNPFIINQLLRKWEIPYSPIETITKKYTYGIVLTGMINFEPATKRVNFLRSSDRIWQTLKLYKNGSIEKILITGGAFGLLVEDTIESAYLKHYLVKIGIPANDIITEEKSRNTYENALYTCRLLKNYSVPPEKCLLITSAIHTRRAKGCFAKQGYTIDTFAVDHYSSVSGNWVTTKVLPGIDAVWKWNSLIHEILGYSMYWISNYL